MILLEAHDAYSVQEHERCPARLRVRSLTIGLNKMPASTWMQAIHPACDLAYNQRTYAFA